MLGVRSRWTLVMPVLVAGLAAVILVLTSWRQAVGIVAGHAYAGWKKSFVVPGPEGSARVIDPQEGGATLSEGMGYGMLFAAATGDRATFARLWLYVHNHLDGNGLMNWKIAAGGQTIGKGGAADADQDIAYALILADRRWPGQGYTGAARRMLQAVLTHEVDGSNLILPGDRWGPRPPLDPSYMAPGYYDAFAAVSGDGRWLAVATANRRWLAERVSATTGLFPDWVAENGTPVQSHDVFGYDALRVPIRLLQAWQHNPDWVPAFILQKEMDTFRKIGPARLVAGYNLNGHPLVDYLNAPYLASFTAASQYRPYSPFAVQMLGRLAREKPGDYYGASLRVWTLLVVARRI